MPFVGVRILSVTGNPILFVRHSHHQHQHRRGHHQFTCVWIITTPTLTRYASFASPSIRTPSPWCIDHIPCSDLALSVYSLVPYKTTLMSEINTPTHVHMKWLLPLWIQHVRSTFLVLDSCLCGINYIYCSMLNWYSCWFTSTIEYQILNKLCRSRCTLEIFIYLQYNILIGRRKYFSAIFTWKVTLVFVARLTGILTTSLNRAQIQPVFFFAKALQRITTRNSIRPPASKKK